MDLLTFFFWKIRFPGFSLIISERKQTTVLHTRVALPSTAVRVLLENRRTYYIILVLTTVRGWRAFPPVLDQVIHLLTLSLWLEPRIPNASNIEQVNALAPLIYFLSFCFLVYTIDMPHAKIGGTSTTYVTVTIPNMFLEASKRYGSMFRAFGPWWMMA